MNALRILAFLFATLAASLLMALPPVTVVLPPVVSADTETMTNVPFRLEATTDGSPAFADRPLESVYSPSWNLLRLTGRGLDASLENFMVFATPDGTVFIMR